MLYNSEQGQRFVVCINNAHYAAALETGKIYSLLPDAQAEAMHMVRIIDESGEDYLYDASYFMEIDLPLSIQIALREAA